MLVKVRAANMDFTSRIATYVGSHRSEDGDVDPDFVHSIAERIISTMEEEIGRPGEHSEPVKVMMMNE